MATHARRRVGFGRRLLAAVVTVGAAVGLLAGCAPAPLTPRELVPWPNYPSLQQPERISNWLVLKCTVAPELDLDPVTGLPRLFNLRTERQLGPYTGDTRFSGLDDVITKFLGGSNGTGNMQDYWRDVSYGGVRILTDIRGWYDAPWKNSEREAPPIGRSLSRVERVRQCAGAATLGSDSAAPVTDFSAYDGIIVVTNVFSDSGHQACSGFTVPDPAAPDDPARATPYPRIKGCMVLDAGGLNVDIAAHEMGHGLGLPHSLWDLPGQGCPAGSPPLPDGEYCDPYDIMGGLPAVAKFPSPNYPSLASPATSSGPGVTAPVLMALGALPPGREVAYEEPGEVGVCRTYRVAAMSQAGGSRVGMPIAVTITSPAGRKYVIEYRQPDGWDQGMRAPGMLLHEMGPVRPYDPSAKTSTLLMGGTLDGSNGLRTPGSAGALYYFGNDRSDPPNEHFRVQLVRVRPELGYAEINVAGWSVNPALNPVCPAP